MSSSNPSELSVLSPTALAEVQGGTDNPHCPYYQKHAGSLPRGLVNTLYRWQGSGNWLLEGIARNC